MSGRTITGCCQTVAAAGTTEAWQDLRARGARHAERSRSGTRSRRIGARGTIHDEAQLPPWQRGNLGRAKAGTTAGTSVAHLVFMLDREEVVLDLFMTAAERNGEDEV